MQRLADKMESERKLAQMDQLFQKIDARRVALMESARMLARKMELSQLFTAVMSHAKELMGVPHTTYPPPTHITAPPFLPLHAKKLMAVPPTSHPPTHLPAPPPSLSTPLDPPRPPCHTSTHPPHPTPTPPSTPYSPALSP